MNGSVSLVRDRNREMDAFTGKRKGATSKLHDREVDQQLGDRVWEMRRSTDWSEAEGQHFAVLFGQLYGQVYGVPCGDLSGPGKFYAAKMANALILERADVFKGNPARFADYMRWAWEEEAKTEKWRRDQGKDGGCLSYRQLFKQGRWLDRYVLSIKRRVVG